MEWDETNLLFINLPNEMKTLQHFINNGIVMLLYSIPFHQPSLGIHFCTNLKTLKLLIPSSSDMLQL